MGTGKLVALVLGGVALFMGLVVVILMQHGGLTVPPSTRLAGPATTPTVVTPKPPEPEPLSPHEVSVGRERYDGKTIRVRGECRLEKIAASVVLRIDNATTKRADVIFVLDGDEAQKADAIFSTKDVRETLTVEGEVFQIRSIIDGAVMLRNCRIID